jgi:citrate synthase
MSARDSDWLDAAAAAELLGVRRATLYAYVSRGLVRARSSGKQRVYARADLEVLRVRSAARRGHAAVAGGALLWGEPVLDTHISSVDASGPRYRGHAALELVRAGTSCERVAELLWTGELPAREPRWPEAVLEPSARAERVAARERPVAKMLLLLVSQDVQAPDPDEALPSEGLDCARRLLRLLALAPALGKGSRVLAAASRAPNLAAALLVALGGPKTRAAERAVGCALVLLADHELNASTFCARVAAGAGADLPRCLLAAHATLSGRRHGGMCDRIEELLRRLERPERALAWVRAELSARRALPGFGHPLYPDGDPRAAPLFELCSAHGQESEGVRTAGVLREAMQLVEGERPTVDLALVALTSSLGLGPGSAAAIFALGRSVGYVAHVFEQREQGHLLRPRARYLGT